MDTFQKPSWLRQGGCSFQMFLDFLVAKACGHPFQMFLESFVISLSSTWACLHAPLVYFVHHLLDYPTRQLNLVQHVGFIGSANLLSQQVNPKSRLTSQLKNSQPSQLNGIQIKENKTKGRDQGTPFLLSAMGHHPWQGSSLHQFLKFRDQNVSKFRQK